jgi:hypothetical protein
MPSRTPLAAARRQPIGEHDGVDRAGARSSDAFEMQGFLVEQAVEHAPGERAVTAGSARFTILGIWEVFVLLRSATIELAAFIAPMDRAYRGTRRNIMPWGMASDLI